MTSNQPPRLAAWILKHFGSGPDNEALMGDLAEQYEYKDSSIWYWRQTLKAIPVSFFRDVRRHKWMASRALVTGWIMWVVAGTALFPLMYHGTNFVYDGRPFRDPRPPLLPYDSGRPQLFTMSTWNNMWPVLGRYPYTSGFTPLGLGVVFPLIVGGMCGWVVARFHPNQQTAVVLLFGGSVLLVNLVLFEPFLFAVGPYVGYAVFMPLAASVAASILGILLGGGLLRDKSNTVTN